MKLTDVKIKKVKPTNKPQKFSDGEGLFLLVTINGSKLWRIAYRYGGKQKTLSLGAYPVISLREARERRSDMKKQLANDIDPSAQRKAIKSANVDNGENFKSIALEWHQRFKPKWKPSHAKTIIDRLNLHVFPWLGSTTLSKITPPELLEVLRRIENRGALETAHRVKSICSQIYRYAIATGRAERDISADLKGALPPTTKKHLASITDPVKVGELLRGIDGFEGTLVVKCALKLAPLVFTRPVELRQSEWSEVDLEAAQWNIPAERMKMNQPHVVPLSKQAIAILKELYPLTGSGKYLFPSVRTNSRPMSDNTLNAAIRRIGYSKDEMTTHGFRAMARTLLDEVLEVRPDFIEHQLAHAVRDPLGRAYNRTTHLENRRKMMQTWANYLDELKA